MINLVHQLIDNNAQRYPDKLALITNTRSVSYKELFTAVNSVSQGLKQHTTARHARIGIYLSKTDENVISMLAASKCQRIFVPINPILKAAQVAHIVNDCQIELLITNSARLFAVQSLLAQLPSLKTIVVIDEIKEPLQLPQSHTLLQWADFLNQPSDEPPNTSTGADTAAIFYTSGSTGKPKGVVLSHQNIVLGAKSVATYLNNSPEDVILAALPFSFDYGFSQLTTSLLVGATCVLLDYLLPKDVLKAICTHKITGLAAVPPLWAQLCKVSWEGYDVSSLRYFTNSGGVLSQANLKTLRTNLPNASPFLMYGLTEAFRSTYLSPDEIDRRPTSIGKAIPNAEILVLDQNGNECLPNQPGELVHLGPLVSQGYWNDIERTNKRFKESPLQPSGIPFKQRAVWSGDAVYRDEDGFLYFVARQDDMIKTSGYRVSPAEIEECIYLHPEVIETAVIGAYDSVLGQAVLVLVTAQNTKNSDDLAQSIVQLCLKELPNYMKPKQVLIVEELPKNANGKIDRSLLNTQYKNYFLSKETDEY